MIRIELFSGHAGFQAIATIWNTVSTTLPRKRFFHFYEWYQSYLDALDSSPDKLYFLVAYREDAPVAIFPLRATQARIRGITLRILELPIHSHMSLSDVLCSAHISCSDATRELIGFLRKQKELIWDALSFPRLLEESELVTLDSAVVQGVYKEFAGTSNYFDCVHGYEAISGQFSKNFRANLRKARNKLAQQTTVEYRSVTDPPSLHAALRELIHIEASGWKGTSGAGTAIQLHPELIRFYESLVDHFSAIQKCRINLLYLDGKAIAGQFCLRDFDTLYLLKIAYDENYQQYSPGGLLLEHVLLQENANPSTRIVSLVTDTKWHTDWKPNAYRKFNVTIYNRTLRGLMLLALQRTMQTLRPLYQKMRKR
jgi:CelD/BcsL family acetyltransferase involved in cellulose biosynthesis